jgi:signal transduction histidine kinase
MINKKHNIASILKHLFVIALESKILMKVFGIFSLLNFPIFYILWSYSGSEISDGFLLRLIAFILNIPLAFINHWPKRFNKYIPAYWYITILFCLPFFGTYMFIGNNDSIAWLTNITLGLFFLLLITDWIAFIIILPLGIILGFLAYYIIQGDPIWKTPDLFSALSNYLWAVVIGAIFAERKEVIHKEKLEVLRAMGGTIAHELRTPLGTVNLCNHGINDYSNRLLQIAEETEELAKDNPSILEKIEDSQIQIKRIQKSSKTIEKTSHSTSLVIDMILTNMKDPSQETHKAIYSIRDLIENALTNYPLEDNQKAWIKLNLEEDFKFFGSELMLSHSIYNLLKNSIYYIRQAGKGEIIITTEKSKNYNKLYFKDTGKGISVEMLPHMFEKFYSKTARGTGLGLAFCKQVMEGLGGKISCRSVYGEYIEFILEFPVNLPTKSNP